MKKKRIILHIAILGTALICMVCVALSTLKFIKIRNSVTGEEANELYGSYYIQCVEDILSDVYEQLDFKRKHGGENIVIEEFKLSTKWLDTAFYYTIVKEGTNKKISTNYYGTDNLRNNICIFNQTGLHFDENYDSPVKESMYSFIDDGTFYYENGSVNVPLKKIQKLCRKNKFYIVMHTKQGEDAETELTYLDKQRERSVTEKQKNIWKKEAIVYAMAAGVFALVVLILYIWLLVIAARKEKGAKPKLQKIDKVWIDVVLVVTVSVYLIAILFVGDVLYDGIEVSDAVVFGGWIFVTMFAVEIALQISESIVRRLNTKNFIKTTLVGKICIYIKRIIVKITSHMKLSAKVIAMCIGLELILFLDFVVVSEMYDTFAALCIIAIPVVIIGVLVWNYFREQEIIIEETNKIAKGEVDNKIYDLMKFSSNKKLSKAVNRIGEGLSNAVSSSLKNERMKTELITNVSHDLKTPLTSIINYVDLLKTEGLDSEKASEYLEVLDRKSQRLKTLTEDLVEVSKLNSGVVKMNIENINIVQLVNQSLAEYSDRFEEKHLRIIENIRKDIMIVKADGKKTWRVLDNLYSNVCKYAMPDTRVYVDVIDRESEVTVSIKNISARALNFRADELMERFVRGDASRTTEGSGLGLSIAKTIVERQNGEMKITLDGDLFKVEITLMK